MRLNRQSPLYVITRLILPAFVFLAFPHLALADGPYTEIDGAINRVTIDDVEYKPITAKLKLGYAISKYAVEFHYAGKTNEDEFEQQKVAVDEQMGLYLRVNFFINNRAKFYLNFGAARTNVVTTIDATETSTKYDDYSYSFGVEDYFPGVKSLNIALEYTELYKDNELDIESLSLGVKYAF